jgi:hypothetical protein
MKKDPALLSRRKKADRFLKPKQPSQNVVEMVPAPPSWLSLAAQGEWRPMAVRLARLGWLNAPGKKELLEIAAQLMAEFKSDPVEYTCAKHTQLRLTLDKLYKQPRLEDVESDKPENPFDGF